LPSIPLTNYCYDAGNPFSFKYYTLKNIDILLIKKLSLLGNKLTFI
jgi:hypothetical protein